MCLAQPSALYRLLIQKVGKPSCENVFQVGVTDVPVFNLKGQAVCWHWAEIFFYFDVQLLSAVDCWTTASTMAV